MKKTLLIIAFVTVLLVAGEVAGNYALRNIDWSSVDGVGTPVTVTQDPITASSSALHVKSTPAPTSEIYVECKMNGISSVMPAQACQKMRDTFGAMAP